MNVGTLSPAINCWIYQQVLKKLRKFCLFSHSYKDIKIHLTKHAIRGILTYIFGSPPIQVNND